MSIVRLNTPLKLKFELDPELYEGVEAGYDSVNHTLFLFNPRIVPIMGKKEGEEVTTGVIKANQTVLLDFGMIFPKRNTVFMTINPALLLNGDVNYPAFYPAYKEDKQGLFVSFAAKKQCTLDKEMWIVGLQVHE